LKKEDRKGAFSSIFLEIGENNALRICDRLYLLVKKEKTRLLEWGKGKKESKREEPPIPEETWMIKKRIPQERESSGSGVA